MPEPDFSDADIDAFTAYLPQINKAIDVVNSDMATFARKISSVMDEVAQNKEKN